MTAPVLASCVNGYLLPSCRQADYSSIFDIDMQDDLACHFAVYLCNNARSREVVGERRNIINGNNRPVGKLAWVAKLVICSYTVTGYLCTSVKRQGIPAGLTEFIKHRIILSVTSKIVCQNDPNVDTFRNPRSWNPRIDADHVVEPRVLNQLIHGATPKDARTFRSGDHRLPNSFT